MVYIHAVWLLLPMHGAIMYICTMYFQQDFYLSSLLFKISERKNSLYFFTCHPYAANLLLFYCFSKLDDFSIRSDSIVVSTSDSHPIDPGSNLTGSSFFCYFSLQSHSFSFHFPYLPKGIFAFPSNLS